MHDDRCMMIMMIIIPLFYERCTFLFFKINMKFEIDFTTKTKLLLSISASFNATCDLNLAFRELIMASVNIPNLYWTFKVFWSVIFCDFRILEIYEINVPKCVADRFLYLVIPSVQSRILCKLRLFQKSLDAEWHRIARFSRSV